MEHNIRILSPEALMPELPALLEQADSIPLLISGGSMSPFLIHGRDIVYLSKPPAQLRKGDMILYCRSSGEHVLHRVYKCKNGQYDLLGDAQSTVESGIRHQQVLAIVLSVKRKGKLLHTGSFLWAFFRGPWLWLRPVRQPVLSLYRLIFRK